MPTVHLIVENSRGEGWAGLGWGIGRQARDVRIKSALFFFNFSPICTQMHGEMEEYQASTWTLRVAASAEGKVLDTLACEEHKRRKFWRSRPCTLLIAASPCEVDDRKMGTDLLGFVHAGKT